MKYLNKIWLYITVLIVVASCADNNALVFHVDKPASVATQDSFNAYGPLKSYIDRNANPGFKLGVAVSMSDYTSKSVMYRLVNSNFDEITVGYGMKHGAVVQADGSLALDNVNGLLDSAKNAGISVYGHTLVWHSNQNATYLKSLIAPLIVTPPAIANSLDLTGLKDATLNGWGATNSGAGITVESNAGMSGTSNAVKLVSSSNSSAPGDLQLVTPEIPVVAGHKYVVILYIKSDVPGEGRVSFEGLNNNTPEEDWMNTGTASATFNTSISWQQVKFQVSDFDGTPFKLHLDLGYKSNVTYTLDADNFYVYDTQGAPSIVNLISNGDFEAGNIDGWGGWGNGSTRGISAKGQGYGDTGYAFWETNPSITGGYWSVQTAYGLPAPLENGQQYTLSFDVKADNTGIIRPELQSPDYSSNGFGMVYLKTTWQHIELTTTVTATDRKTFIISYGEMAGTVYLDNVKLFKTAGSSNSSNLVVEKTAFEKEQILNNAMTTWVSGMVKNCAPYVKAWDVVNEPMDDGNPYELKTGAGKTLASDEFYWQDYLGKDYAVTAFKLARENGNPGDLLFINDYNLEYNLDKCKGLIDYVKYIESKGEKVDGIGTQMHIGIDSNKDNIAQMFQLLAATGKLIKVSELDVRVNTSDPTAEELQQQADMYKYVAEMYFKYVPANQRYGITIWSPLDSDDNSLWLPGDRQGLWNINFDRKRAYAGFADGLSGK